MGVAQRKEPHLKAGTSSSQYEIRKRRFINAMLTNGGNQRQAAITAGYAEISAHNSAARFMKDDGVRAALKLRTENLLRVEDLTTDRIILEMGRVATFDPRRLYDENDNLKPPSQWDDDVAAVISSLDVEELWEGRGDDKDRVGSTRKIRLWDKNSSLEKLARIHGLFERDNRQKRDELSINVEFVAAGAAPPPTIVQEPEPTVVEPPPRAPKKRRVSHGR